MCVHCGRKINILSFFLSFYMPGKIPLLLTEGIRAYLMQKKAVGGSKNIPLTAEGIIRRM
jgi:hypothetical protein